MVGIPGLRDLSGKGEHSAARKGGWRGGGGNASATEKKAQKKKFDQIKWLSYIYLPTCLYGHPDKTPPPHLLLRRNQRSPVPLEGEGEGEGEKESKKEKRIGEGGGEERNQPLHSTPSISHPSQNEIK